MGFYRNTLPWYSEWLDIVNKRGLTGSFTISRLGCIMYLESEFGTNSSSEDDTSPERLRVAWKNPIFESPGPFFRSFCICASISMLCKLTNFWGKENFLLSKPGNFFLISVGPSNWIEGCWGGCGWKVHKHIYTRITR